MLADRILEMETETLGDVHIEDLVNTLISPRHYAT